MREQIHCRNVTLVLLGITVLGALAGPVDGATPGRSLEPQASAGAAPGGSPAAGDAASDTVDMDALLLQVRLDRAGFSPGVIDARVGPSTERARALYEQHRGAATPPDVAAVVSYVITAGDAAGPFTDAVPEDLVAQASLPALGYTSVIEALAERFHTTPELLQRLNPGARFVEAERIRVPNVDPLVVPVEQLRIGGASGEKPAGRSGAPSRRAAAPGRGGRGQRSGARSTPDGITQRPDVTVTVSETASQLTVTDGAGQVVFAAPVTTGSEHDPLPLGEWKVTGLQFNPVFHYNPALFWDADPSHSKAAIQPGPNNPVGLVWIDLDKPHYGLHGTPEPAAIGRSQSHGCVRLTNWDAIRLAGLVKPGTKVVFTR